MGVRPILISKGTTAGTTGPPRRWAARQISVIGGCAGKVGDHGPIPDFSPLDDDSFTHVAVTVCDENFTIHDLGVPAQ
jgi:hypothetical protein